MSSRRGYSLIEMLMVVAVLGVLAGAAIVSASAGSSERLRNAAEMVAGDLAYCRSLAVTYNSTYDVTFDLVNNRYKTMHTGTNGALNVLPKAVFADYDTPTSAHIVDLDEVPSLSGEVRLAAVRTGENGTADVSAIEFGSLGHTTRTEPTTVWLKMGTASGGRYISIQVDPVTGIVSIGDVASSVPAGVAPVGETTP